MNNPVEESGTSKLRKDKTHSYLATGQSQTIKGCVLLQGGSQT